MGTGRGVGRPGGAGLVGSFLYCGSSNVAMLLMTRNWISIP